LNLFFLRVLIEIQEIQEGVSLASYSSPSSILTFIATVRLPSVSFFLIIIISAIISSVDLYVLKKNSNIYIFKYIYYKNLSHILANDIYYFHVTNKESVLPNGIR
ncbi:hypothetical protein ACJX0J_011979, partial [Zea mays]